MDISVLVSSDKIGVVYFMNVIALAMVLTKIGFVSDLPTPWLDFIYWDLYCYVHSQ